MYKVNKFKKFYAELIIIACCTEIMLYKNLLIKNKIRYLKILLIFLKRYDSLTAFFHMRIICSYNNKVYLFVFLCCYDVFKR